MQVEYSNEDVFISHAGLQKDCFAVHLRQALGAGGNMSVFLDERSIQLGQPSGRRMEEACRKAKLVIFVITRPFLSSKWCMDELKWAMEERKNNTRNEEPAILPLMYPGNVVRGCSQKERNALAKLSKIYLIELLMAGIPVKVDDLNPLSFSLEQLVMLSLPPEKSRKEMFKGQDQQGVGGDMTTLEQRRNDLAELTKFCCIRADSYGRCVSSHLCV